MWTNFLFPHFQIQDPLVSNKLQGWENRWDWVSLQIAYAWWLNIKGRQFQLVCGVLFWTYNEIGKMRRKKTEKNILIF